MFRISAKVVLGKSVTIDMSGGFLLMMLLLVVGWITVTHFSGVSLSSVFINYSAFKMVQLESYEIPVDMLVWLLCWYNSWFPVEHHSVFKTASHSLKPLSEATQNLPVHHGIPTLVLLIPWHSLWCLALFSVPGY